MVGRQRGVSRARTCSALLPPKPPVAGSKLPLAAALKARGTARLLVCDDVPMAHQALDPFAPTGELTARREFIASLEEPGAGVLLENFRVAHVAAQRLDRSVA